MATIARIPVEWSGLAVEGNGVSTFYTSNSTTGTYLAALREFFFSLRGMFPDGVSLVFPGAGDTINDATGELNGTWTSSAPAVVTGTQTGVFAQGVGARMVWRTAGITRGRRVRGTTFLVPIAGNQYGTDGTLADGVATGMASAGATLRAADSGSMRIWSRPSGPSASDGASHAVTSAEGPDAVSWLRSRRT